jgi:O-antigen ligase
VPYFLQNRIRNVVTMENEYARILLELGLPGLMMWALFIGWVFTRRHIRRTDMFYFGRRLAYIACACAFGMGLIGVGLFTSVPGTTLTFLLTGWFVVREVRAPPVPGIAAAAPEKTAAPEKVAGTFSEAVPATFSASSASGRWA